jgi:hypothetical protein
MPGQEAHKPFILKRPVVVALDQSASAAVCSEQRRTALIKLGGSLHLNFFEKKSVVEIGRTRGRHAVLQGASQTWNYPNSLMRLQLGINKLLVELPDPGGLKQPVADVSTVE